MSPRKLTEDDKQEILEQYRNSEATTSTLATSFEVSSSTISRFLKNKLTTDEYEDLIQQKRLARTPRGEKSSTAKSTSKAKTTKKTKKTKTKTKTKSEPAKEESKTKSKTRSRKSKKVLSVADNEAMPELTPADNQLQETPAPAASEPKSGSRVRRRRRSSAKPESAVAIQEIAPKSEVVEEVSTVPTSATELDSDLAAEEAPVKLVLDDISSKSSERATSKSDRLILKSERLEAEEEDDDDEEDLSALTEMLGEDLEDINDEEDEEDEEDEWEEVTYDNRAANLSDIQILPLSQASLPRTCYLVIDRSAELIVKPLAEFADLGIIPDTEVRQRTLPVFDNHRIAKRFSHRRERVIKVPDGRMLQKTSHHLQEKGITRLLIDGQIYSLAH